VLIEDAGAAKGLIQQLNDDRQIRPIDIKPEGSKEDRMAAQSAVIEAGRVFLPQNAPWLGEFRMEMAAFPSGKHDDQVDSVS
jgi:predicted phage terminase large subunit-like protein